MNRHTFLWAAIVIITAVVCAKTAFLATVFAILVIGVIPGTDATIPVWVMLTAYPAVFLLAMYWLVVQPLYIGEKSPMVKPVKVAAKRVAKTTRRKSTAAKKRPARATS